VSPTTTYAYLVGRVLATLRSQASIDQAELASRVGVSQSTWSKVERGQSALTIDQLARAADALGQRPSAVLARVEAAVVNAQRRGITVSYARNPGSVDEGVGLLGAAAIGAIIATALSKRG
jgi:transcriptional regulator with XRE-family HTH domain